MGNSTLIPYFALLTHTAFALLSFRVFSLLILHVPHHSLAHPTWGEGVSGSMGPHCWPGLNYSTCTEAQVLFIYCCSKIVKKSTVGIFQFCMNKSKRIWKRDKCTTML